MLFYCFLLCFFIKWSQNGHNFSGDRLAAESQLFLVLVSPDFFNQAVTGDGKMTEPLFITYSNNSLRKEPRNFYKIIDKIDDEIVKQNILFKRTQFELELARDLPIPHNPREQIGNILKQVVKNILDFCNDYGRSVEIFRRHGSAINTEVAFQACFGWEDFYCLDPYIQDGKKHPEGWFTNRCAEYAPNMKQLVDFELYTCEDKLKCYECEQLFFVKILEQINDGVEYDEIPEFLNFLETVNKWGSREILFTEHKKQESPFKKNISEKFRWISPLKDSNTWSKGPNDKYPYKHTFNEYLRSFIAYSLENFLLSEDRRKINKCEACNHFYIKKTLRKNERFCCDKCRMAHHNQKRIISGEHAKYKRERKMKGKPPASYYG